MNLQGLRWQIIAGTAVLTLGILFGGGYILRNQTVDGPLREALHSADAVEHYALERRDDKWEITVRLKPMEDLSQAYAQLNDEVKGILKEKPFILKVEDQRTDELAMAFRRINLHLHEGLATGHYAAMADRTESEAMLVGAEARVSMDQHRVYLHVQKGTAYLYAVLERPELTPPRTAEGGFGL